MSAAFSGLENGPQTWRRRFLRWKMSGKYERAIFWAVKCLGRMGGLENHAAAQRRHFPARKSAVVRKMARLEAINRSGFVRSHTRAKAYVGHDGRRRRLALRQSGLKFSQFPCLSLQTFQRGLRFEIIEALGGMNQRFEKLFGLGDMFQSKINGRRHIHIGTNSNATV